MCFSLSLSAAPLGHTPALACAPNNQVAECLAIILQQMFPFSPNNTLRMTGRIDTRTVDLTGGMFTDCWEFLSPIVELHLIVNRCCCSHDNTPQTYIYTILMRSDCLNLCKSVSLINSVCNTNVKLYMKQKHNFYHFVKPGMVDFY